MSKKNKELAEQQVSKEELAANLIDEIVETASDVISEALPIMKVESFVIYSTNKRYSRSEMTRELAEKLVAETPSLIQFFNL